MGKKLFVVKWGVGSVLDFMNYYLADNISEVIKNNHEGSTIFVEELGNDEYTLTAEQLKGKHLYEVEVTYEISDKTVYVFAEGFEQARELVMQGESSIIPNGMFVDGRIRYTTTPDKVKRIEALPGTVEVI